jgi:autotransporter-associated beta strand protein
VSAFGDARTFTGGNTYSGATDILAGTLVFSESGSAVNSAVSISSRTVLRLDNTATVLANRISDTAELTMRGGSIEMVGNATVPVTEQLGTLNFGGGVQVNIAQPGAAATVLNFAGIARQGHATISFTGNGMAGWTGMSNGGSGIIGTYVTIGNEWATAAGDGYLDPLTTYQADINLAGAGDNVKILGDSSVALASSASISTLNFQNSGPGSSQLSLGNNVLTLSEGGILSSGNGAPQVTGGELRIGTSELVVTNYNDLRIDSTITEAGFGTSLVKSGAGTLTLTGQNTYSGTTVINEGVLAVGSDANLGTANSIEFGGGTLRATQSFSSSKNITRSTSSLAVIDTGGFDVTLTGVTDRVSKTGQGVLTLPNPNLQRVFVSDGTLRLPNPTSGVVGALGGTLEASGTLIELQASNEDFTLDLGGPGAAILTTQRFLGGVTGSKMTIRFDLGPSAHDLWVISNFGHFTFTLGAKSVLFDFHALGDVSTGVSYALIDLPSLLSPPPQASQFDFSPASKAEGWKGTFSVNSGEVRVTLTSTPEPGCAALLAAGFISFLRRRPRPSL